MKRTNLLCTEYRGLVDEYEPPLEPGDTLGILCIATKDNLKAIFELNGESLGADFDVPRETMGLKILPFVRFLDSGSVSVVSCTNSTELITQQLHMALYYLEI